jgi:hypothetical protein
VFSIWVPSPAPKRKRKGLKPPTFSYYNLIGLPSKLYSIFVREYAQSFPKTGAGQLAHTVQRLLVFSKVIGPKIQGICRQLSDVFACQMPVQIENPPLFPCVRLTEQQQTENLKGIRSCSHPGPGLVIFACG